jgi:uncharacterized damage-inducible protein DinB
MDLAAVGALFRYNRWANERVLDAVARAPHPAFVHELHSLPEGSIRGVLTHIVWSEWIWLRRWKGTTDLLFQPADFSMVPRELVFVAAEFPDVETLRDRFAAVGQEASDYHRELRPEDLERVFEYRMPTGARWSCPLSRQLVHAVNHSTYHRGQVAVMLRERGYPPAPSDFLSFEDGEA